MEHRNTYEQEGDAVTWAEANMWVYRYGEISHTPRCRRPVHAIQGFQVNRGEPVSSTSCVKCGMPNNLKGRMANVIQCSRMPE